MIIDTNALSAIADHEAGIEIPLMSMPVAAIPVIVLGEYFFGIFQSKRRAGYEAWLEKSLPAYRVLDVTRETSRRYAELQVELKQSGTPIPSNDLWIAALCREHRMPLLSRDRHFDRVKGLRRVDW